MCASYSIRCATMKTAEMAKDDRIDWLLFRSQLEAVDFGNRVLKSEQSESADLRRRMRERDFFVAEKGIRHTAETCAVRDRATQADAGDARAREKQSAETGKTLRAARDRVRARDIDPLFNESLMTLDEGSAPKRTRRFGEVARCRARCHSWVRRSIGETAAAMVDFAPMGEANYNYYLKHVLLLPLDAATGGDARPRRAGPLSRARSATARSVHWPIPTRPAAKSIPPIRQSF